MPADRRSEPDPRSLYVETAAASPLCEPLSRDQKAEIVIVGAGYTGLSAALHLAERGCDVVVIESRDIGFGASGRNGGQVNPGLKREPEKLLAIFGLDLGDRLARLADQAPDVTFDLIARHGIDCEAHRGGTLRAAGPRRSEAQIREHVRQWSTRGADIALID